MPVGEHVVRGPDRGHEADPHEHVAELRDRRVGEDPLDVVLGHADDGRQQGR